MTVNDKIKAIAGLFILFSISMAYLIDAAWLFMTAFVGLNLLQSSFTKWCLMEKILKKKGEKASCSV